jgi:quercetin dioxygenase-like cupin family protein
VLVVVHVQAAQSQGRLGVWESEEPRGSRLPLHVHEREDEQLCVLDGDVTVVVGDHMHQLTSGDTLALPRGVPHAHLVRSSGAQLLTIATPGGFERLFTELGVRALNLSTPPPPPDDAILIAAVRELGVDVVGPPLAPAAPAKSRDLRHVLDRGLVQERDSGTDYPDAIGR